MVVEDLEVNGLTPKEAEVELVQEDQSVTNFTYIYLELVANGLSLLLILLPHITTHLIKHHHYHLLAKFHHQ
ncbi:hypothetical protein Lalb_Chr25g0279041 [Lupinus albus]|uniref:Uncharacterized protein n=1 Tax=Lupinus albus TaxID=3870 RepID=A0A6A4MJN7_LUPAL|nr:hypothetical protein Lalb_Chr25g0279041 [Lupinus albus]